MEPDRYQQNQRFYITGLVCLISSMVFFGVGAYIFPHVAFGLTYNLPGFVFEWVNLIQSAYDVSEKTAGWFIFLIFFVLGLLFSLVTYIASRHIDNEIYAIEEPEVVDEKKQQKNMRETGPFILKILLLIGVIFLIAELIHWVISSR